MTDDIDEAQILQRLDMLPMAARTVFLLHRVDGLDYGQIAWRLGLDTKQVERHVARAVYTLAWGSRRRWWNRWREWRQKGSDDDPA